MQVIARLPADQGGHPLLVAGSHGNGRTLAWTSDIGPHWLPNAFVRWPGYKRLWIQALRWSIVVTDAAPCPWKRLQGYHVSRGDPAETSGDIALPVLLVLIGPARATHGPQGG